MTRRTVAGLTSGKGRTYSSSARRSTRRSTDSGGAGHDRASELTRDLRARSARDPTVACRALPAPPQLHPSSSAPRTSGCSIPRSMPRTPSPARWPHGSSAKGARRRACPTDSQGPMTARAERTARWSPPRRTCRPAPPPHEGVADQEVVDELAPAREAAAEAPLLGNDRRLRDERRRTRVLIRLKRKCWASYRSHG